MSAVVTSPLASLRRVDHPSTVCSEVMLVAISGKAMGIGNWLNWRWPMPHYFFGIKNGHRLV